MIIIQVDTRNVKFMLSGYQRTIPKAADKGVRKLASFAARTYLTQAQKAGIKSFTGKFYGTFGGQISNPARLGEHSYGVSVAGVKRGNVNYAIALDRMKPHSVALKKGRLISQWTKKRGFKGRFVFVSPHPYINQANRIIGKNVKPIMESEINKAIKRKGR